MSKLLFSTGAFDPNDIAEFLFKIIPADNTHIIDRLQKFILGTDRYTLDHEHATTQGENTNHD